MTLRVKGQYDFINLFHWSFFLSLISLGFRELVGREDENLAKLVVDPRHLFFVVEVIVVKDLVSHGRSESGPAMTGRTLGKRELEEWLNDEA